MTAGVVDTLSNVQMNKPHLKPIIPSKITKKQLSSSSSSSSSCSSSEDESSAVNK